MPTLKYQGCSLFRQRIVASLLSGQPLKIEHIRSKDDAPGLQDFEANFLRLIEKLTDGCHIEINETGTTLRFKPGLLQGSSSGSTGTGRVVTHDCGTSRSIGWFIEGIIPIALFCKTPVEITFTGVTNDGTDLSVDILKTVTLPLLQNFGAWGATLNVKRRGAMPKGGGIVEFKLPPVKKALTPLHVTEEGLVKRIRGIAFCAKISPNVVNRVVDSCREVLNHVLPDVFINTDHYKGQMAGDSPGYSLSLVAETTTGVLLSVERTASSRLSSAPAAVATGGSNWVGASGVPTANTGGPELPEDVGREGAMMLLQEIHKGGVVDSMHQPLVLQLMVLTPEDVSKVRFGALTAQSVQVLRLLREAFGVTFKIKQETHPAMQFSANHKRGSEGAEKAAKKAKYEEESGSGSDGSDAEDEEDDNNSNEGSDEDDANSEDDEENDFEEQDSQDEECSDGSDEEEEEEENEGEGSDGDNDSEESEPKAGKKNSNAPVVPVPDRTTVLLSCYGVGYSNVFRKAT
eukprot:Colp12_sorted_trinity150504_noHs@32145